MLVKDKIVEVGGYNPNIKIEDFYVFLKISNLGYNFLSTDKSLVYYRRHEDNLSSKSEIMWDAVSEILLEYKEDNNYKHALSRSMLIHAHDLQLTTKKEAVNWALKATVNYPKVIFSKSFLKLCIKLCFK